MVPEPDRWDGMCNQSRERATQGLFSLRLRRGRVFAYGLGCGPGWMDTSVAMRKVDMGGGWVVPEPRNTEMPKRLSDGGDRQVRFPTPFAAAAPPLIGF